MLPASAGGSHTKEPPPPPTPTPVDIPLVDAEELAMAIDPDPEVEPGVPWEPSPPAPVVPPPEASSPELLQPPNDKASNALHAGITLERAIGSSFRGPWVRSRSRRQATSPYYVSIALRCSRILPGRHRCGAPAAKIQGRWATRAINAIR